MPKIIGVYINFLKCKSNEHTFTDPINASFIKYIINCFLATKVILMVLKLFESSDAKEDWTSFIKILQRTID